MRLLLAPALLLAFASARAVDDPAPLSQLDRDTIGTVVNLRLAASCRADSSGLASPNTHRIFGEPQHFQR
jgi:hypothetical protein